jgi:hypothetical protein
MMAKTYTLNGPIHLEMLTSQQALSFAAAVIDAIPSYSMGTASLNIQASGPATEGDKHKISGRTIEELKASLAKVKPAPKDPSDVSYEVRGRVDLVDLSLEDGIEVIDAAMHAIPTPDALVFTAMIAQESNGSRK